MDTVLSSWVFSVGAKDFPTKVIEQSKHVPVVVDFWAPWCGPCRQLTPILEALVQERKGEILLAKVNIDDDQALAAQYRIDAVPTVIGFRGGRAVLEFAGVLPEADLRRFFDSLGPSPADREVLQARVLEKTDPVQAEKIYRDALARDPKHEIALLGLAHLLMEQGKFEEAGQLLENLGPGSEHAEEAERLTAQLFLKKLASDLPSEESIKAKVAANPKSAQARYELGCLLAAGNRSAEALDMLFSAGERDAKLASTQVREAMVQIFHLVGNDSALANDYRNRLSLLLY